MSEYLLKRYEDRISNLREMVEACLPDAVYEIRRLADHLAIATKSGQINNLDYNRLDHEIEDITREYVRKCTRPAIVRKTLDSAVYAICSTSKNPTERRVFMQDLIFSLNRKNLIRNMDVDNYLREFVEKAEKCKA